MQIRFRPLLLATGALLLSAHHASAQFIELLLEAPVTIQASFTTTTTTTTSAERKITASTPPTRLLQEQIIDDLRAAGIITDSVSAGWTLVAVAPAPADLAFVDGAFTLYAVKGNSRVRVPLSKFRASNHYDDQAYGIAAKYSEKHLGQYVISSKGSVTAHAAYHYQPAFTVNGATFTVTDSLTDGFATIAYTAKDAADGYEVFFFAPSSIRATTRGSFVGTRQVGGGASADTTGLVTLTITAQTPKLVPATLYPDVDYFYNPVNRY